MTPTLPKRGTARVALARGAAFLLLWLVLMPSLKPGDLAVGLLAVCLATFASLRLLPPAAGHLRFVGLLALLPHLLRESVRSGLDVAGRALHPRVRLHPGFVRYPTASPPGFARNTFASITSLLPGSVPAADHEDAIVFHCLDDRGPVVEQMRQEEQRLARALVPGERHG